MRQKTHKSAKCSNLEKGQASGRAPSGASWEIRNQFNRARFLANPNFSRNRKLRRNVGEFSLQRMPRLEDFPLELGSSPNYLGVVENEVAPKYRHRGPERADRPDYPPSEAIYSKGSPDHSIRPIFGDKIIKTVNGEIRRSEPMEGP